MITHVAIKDGLQVWSLPRPNRHHNVIQMMWDELNPTEVPEFILARGTQGFLDHTGRFLDRREAKVYAGLLGQIKSGCGKHKDLYSEDLW